MSNHMSVPNTAVPCDDFSTVWYVEQIAHAALTRKSSIISASTVSCMSKLDVRNMSVKTPWIRSSIAFACGFLIVVGLCLSPYESHRDSK